MIYTVTFNPSLDYVIGVKDYQPGLVNRVTEEKILPGGKGINVSIVLQNLGHKNTAFGFIAGFTGREIAKRLNDLDCSTDFIEINSGFSRINVKLKTNDETDINGIGPDISDRHISELFKKLDCIKNGDILVLAGSIPSSLPDTIYEDIMFRLQDKNVYIIVDATKDLLVQVLRFRPFLIKPNHHELGDIFGVTLKEKEDIIHYGMKLLELGARNVLVSMAGDGAIFLSEDGQVYESPAPKGTVVNSVGAGDSMVAGFIAGYLERNEFQYAFKMGVATGSASAFSEELATKQEVDQMIQTL